MTIRAIDKPRPEKLLYTLDDAAYVLSISRRTLAYRIAGGQLKIRRIGNRTLVPAAEIRRMARHDDLTPCVPLSAR